MRKRLPLESLEQDLNAFFEHLAVGILVEEWGAEGLDLTGVIAAPDAKDEPPAGQDVGHRVILGDAQRMPHRPKLKPQPMFRFLVTPHRCIAIIRRFGSVQCLPAGNDARPSRTCRSRACARGEKEIRCNRLKFLDSRSGKQGLAGRGKAIAATGTSRPLMA